MNSPRENSNPYARRKRSSQRQDKDEGDSITRGGKSTKDPKARRVSSSPQVNKEKGRETVHLDGVDLAELWDQSWQDELANETEKKSINSSKEGEAGCSESLKPSASDSDNDLVLENICKLSRSCHVKGSSAQLEDVELTNVARTSVDVRVVSDGSLDKANSGVSRDGGERETEDGRNGEDDTLVASNTTVNGRNNIAITGWTKGTQEKDTSGKRAKNNNSKAKAKPSDSKQQTLTQMCRRNESNNAGTGHSNGLRGKQTESSSEATSDQQKRVYYAEDMPEVARKQHHTSTNHALGGNSLCVDQESMPHQMSQDEFRSFSQALSQCYLDDDGDNEDEDDDDANSDKEESEEANDGKIHLASEDEMPYDLDLPDDQLQFTWAQYSQGWEYDSSDYPETSARDSFGETVRDPANRLESPSTYRYDPYPMDAVGTRTYNVGEAWYNHQNTEKVYTIVGFKLRGKLEALCRVSRKMSRTFLGGEESANACLEKEWIEEVGEVLVGLRSLNRIVPDWKQPTILWEQTEDSKRDDPEELRYGFAYIHNQGQPEPFETEGAPKVLDLFAGCGGMSRGFDKAGFEVTHAVEMDDAAAESVKGNFHNTTVFAEDVKHFLARCRKNSLGYPKRGASDHEHASTPCQGYSTANRAADGGKNGRKNRELIHEFVESIRLGRPVTATFENVTGILAKKHIRYLKQIVKTLFFDLQYNIRQCVLNAADYGDPQNRQRVFLFVSKKGVPLPTLPKPTHGPGRAHPHRTVRDCIGDLAQIAPEIGSGRVELNGKVVLNHSREGTERKSEIMIIDPDAPATTLYGKSTKSLVHYDADRLLTVRELARLQSFPDHHEFPRNRNISRKLIFNAVPVRLAEAVAKSVMKSYHVKKDQSR